MMAKEFWLFKNIKAVTGKVFLAKNMFSNGRVVQEVQSANKEEIQFQQTEHHYNQLQHGDQENL
jgi:hypothetical protein